MRIEQKELRKIKIILDHEDMQNYDITFAELDYTQIDTKRVVWELLSKARSETGFEFSDGSLLVEAFPSPSGGCVLYFTSVLDDTKKGRLKLCRGYFGPYIFSFGNCDHMIDACIQTQKLMKYHIVKSELYFFEETYYLAVYSSTKLDNIVKNMLLEYGNFFGDGKKLSFIGEHGKLLCAPKAIETVSTKVNAN